MGWQKRLRDIALAGGLAGGCASTVVGTTGSTGMGGAGIGGSTTDGIPPCNANPDPCCPCSHAGQGGYGGASCVANGCQAMLDCIAAPTAACCNNPSQVYTCTLSTACTDAGFRDSGC